MAASEPALATVITTPPSLAAGDHYRLVFVRAGTTDATSGDITTYNAFTSSQAQGLGLTQTTWDAIASTAGVSAATNIACTPSCASDPIFLVDGTEVASSTANLFSGSLVSPIELDQNGTLSQSYVWTGSTSAGAADPTDYLGSTDPELGYSGAASFAWAVAGSLGSDLVLPVYAISGDLVAPGNDPTTVPEPASAVLLGLATGLTALLRRRAA